jgi:hypothetical protein
MSALWNFINETDKTNDSTNATKLMEESNESDREEPYLLPDSWSGQIKKNEKDKMKYIYFSKKIQPVNLVDKQINEEEELYGFLLSFLDLDEIMNSYGVNSKQIESSIQKKEIFKGTMFKNYSYFYNEYKNEIIHPKLVSIEKLTEMIKEMGKKLNNYEISENEEDFKTFKKIGLLYIKYLFDKNIQPNFKIELPDKMKEKIINYQKKLNKQLTNHIQGEGGGRISREKPPNRVKWQKLLRVIEFIINKYITDTTFDIYKKQPDPRSTLNKHNNDENYNKKQKIIQKLNGIMTEESYPEGFRGIERILTGGWYSEQDNHNWN